MVVARIGRLSRDVALSEEKQRMSGRARLPGGKRRKATQKRTRRARLPGGKPRKATQKRTRRAGLVSAPVAPNWSLGDRVCWGGRFGLFLRSLNDGIHAEIRIEQRVYRVKIAELRRG